MSAEGNESECLVGSVHSMQSPSASGKPLFPGGLQKARSRFSKCVECTTKGSREGGSSAFCSASWETA